MLKIKFGGNKKKEEDKESPSTEQPPPLERSQSIKLSFAKTPTTEQAPSLDAPASEPKAKKKPGPKKKTSNDASGSGATIKLGGKKRARGESDAGIDEATPAKRTLKPTEKSGDIDFKRPIMPASESRAPKMKLHVNTKNIIKPSLSKSSAAPKSGVKLTFGKSANSAMPQSATSVSRVRIKAKGKKPVRVFGQGYDSEDEEAEDDPVIESHCILRMEEGEDCDYLRKAIAESAIRHKTDGSKAGGPDFWMKHFDKDGRHGVVSVRGNLYATSLLDLPCIIEAMKSWDKKGWYKTTDICQILLVLGRVKTEEEARNYALPAEVDKENWQYPHGLTPPMQWVRKRRFRRRVNRRHIERVEADVEELLARDKEWERDYAETSINVEYVDPDLPVEYDDLDAEGEEDYEMEYQDQDGNVYDADEMEMDDDTFAAALEAGMMEAGEEDADGDAQPTTTIVTDPAMLQGSPDTLAPVDSAITPHSASAVTATGTEDEDDDDDDDDEEDEVASDEEDDEEKAQRQEREQALAEVEETKREIAEAEERYKRQANPLLKQKIKNSIDKLKADLQVKMSGLGLEEEE